MSATLLYRTASVLLLLFAAGHQAGFRRVRPEWHLDGVVGQMRSTSFNVQGAERTYYDFFQGFGFFVTVLLVFSALLAWQLGGMTPAQLATIPLVRWGFFACYAIITLLTWRYFFAMPLVFCVPIMIALAAAAWQPKQL
jgi:hypothetical protein